MISKLARAQENWLFKVIFIAVAVSFISLFGVTGYINSASQNQDVINVGGKKTSQSEFSYRLNKEISSIQRLGGDDFEITDEMRNAISEGVLRQIIDEGVIDQTMLANDIYFPKDFIRQVIFNQPEFRNPLNGSFNKEVYNRYLATAGLSEDAYVNIVKRFMARRLLVDDLVRNLGVPSVLSNAIHKMDNQRKSFKYVTVSPDDVKIERKISDDEIAQYFDDFSENFIVPETRDVSVLFVPISNILNKYAASDDMIAEYYKENKKSFDMPEKREVLQMVFMEKAVAEKALSEVISGKDFYEVAKNNSAENANEPTLGLVASDELTDDLSNEVFAMEINKPKLLQVADTWQVVSVKQIVSAKESTLEGVRDQIIQTLNDENMYDAIRDARAEIDDAINGGKSMGDVAKMVGVVPITVKGVKESEVVVDVPDDLKSVVSNLDFNTLVFSYGRGEISSTEEFDDGLVVVEVTNIIDEHLPKVDEVKDKIVDLWTVQEKAALAKEITDDIMADVNDNSTINDAAKARNLEVFRSEPISRNDTFLNFLPNEIGELFLLNDGDVKVFERAGNNFIVVVPFETVDYTDDMTAEKAESIKNRAEASLFIDASKAMLDSYAADFKIDVDYERAGFEE